MYEAFYGLKTRPFLMLPDPDFLFWSEAHTLAFTMLRYGLTTRAPITVVTGDIGAGKTTLIRQLLREVPEDVKIGLISNMQAGRGELLQWVMMALDQSVEAESYVSLFKRFQDYLIDAYARRQRVVLIIDEAQNLDVKTLEELRMLSNINTDQHELLQLILVGQPQLRELLRLPELVQFAQRVSADFNLEPLSCAEVERYIDCRLEHAGAQWRIFERRTCRLIHEATGGVPRLINTLCDMCLVYGYAAETKVVDEALLCEFLIGAKRRNIYGQFSPLADGPQLLRRSV
jgi:general secretion pathway protein A